MFKKGQKPAIDYGLSVSRLGGNVQNELIKKIGSKVRRELLTYLEKVDVYQLVNIESMSEDLRNQLLRGEKIMNLLKQPKFSPISATELNERFKFIDEDYKPSDDEYDDYTLGDSDSYEIEEQEEVKEEPVKEKKKRKEVEKVKEIEPEKESIEESLPSEEEKEEENTFEETNENIEESTL